jgi:uncharacterized delta-60 repeat protein
MSAKTKVSQAPYYVAVGRSRGGPTFEPSSLSYSLDGITWSASALPAEIDNFGNGVFGGDKFVAVTGNNTNKAAYSTNGINWTATTLPSARAWSALAYGDGKFVVLSADGSNVAAYSTDGITWTQTTLPASGSWVSVTYGDGKFVAIALYTFASAYSTDGITWNAGTMPTQQAWSSVAYGAGKFVALIDDSTNFAYSTNGITWTLGSMPYSYQRWVRIAYGNGKFVALVNNSDKSAYSLDGISWTASTMPSSKYWSAITYGNGKFVALAAESTTTAYSTDGITWSTSNITSAAGWASISYGNGTWRDMVAPHIKVSGAWKIAKSAYIKVSGSWKNWFLQGGIIDREFSAKLSDFVLYSRDPTRHQGLAVAIQLDGKILLGGYFLDEAESTGTLRRINPDGSWDQQFSNNLIPNYPYVYSLAIQADNKILVGRSAPGMARLNSDGTPDSSFNIGTGFATGQQFQIPEVNSIILQPDGKILVGGYFALFNSQSLKGFVRLNSNGSLDTAFMNNLGTGFASSFQQNLFPIYKIILQPDGKILVGGSYDSFNGVSAEGLVRLNSDGTRDTSFVLSTQQSGLGRYFSPNAMALQSDGKIILGNESGLNRRNSNGTYDPSFNTTINDFAGDVSDLAIDSNGKVLVLLRNNVTYRGVALPKGVVRLNSDSSLDTSFSLNSGSGFGGGNIWPRAMAIQSDKKIVAVGEFETFNGVPSPLIVRLSGEASYD